METLSCPFCDFTDDDSYFMIQHVELLHPEGESPFVVREDNDDGLKEGDENAGSSDPVTPASATGSDYVDCPHKCGEVIPAAELPNHIDFHIAEGMALEDVGLDLDLSTGPCNDSQAVEDIATHFSTDLPQSLRNRGQLRQSRSPSGHTSGSGRSLKDFLLGTPSPSKSRKDFNSISVPDGRVRRLGVSEPEALPTSIV